MIHKSILIQCIGMGLLCSSMAGVTLEQFKNPPDDAKPLTWMHMMNQNISAEGLEKDLQAISDAGLGGAAYIQRVRGHAAGACSV